MLKYILLAYKIFKWILEPSRLLSSHDDTFHLWGQELTQLFVIKAQLHKLTKSGSDNPKRQILENHLHMV